MMKKILLTSLVFLLFISCGLDDGPPIEEVPAELRISSFDLNKIEVTAGDDVKASWKIQGADKISLVIEPDGEPKQELPITDPLSELTRPVLKDTVFRLVATQGPRKIEKTQSVAVLPAEASQGGDPSILIDFNASEKCLRSGQTTRLSWQVQNADSLEFDPVSLMIAPNAFRGEKVVPLQVNTTFKLTARKGANASAFKSVVVRVDPIRYTTTLTEKIVRDHSEVAIDPQDPEHFYLATTTNLYEWLRTVLTNLDVVTRDEFKAVTVNQTDPDMVYAAHHEIVRRSPDGGQTWPTAIPIIDLGRPQNISSIAAKDHDLIIAGNSGIFHHDSTSRENPTIDLVSQIAGLKKVFISNYGFFASTATDVYYSFNADSWVRMSFPSGYNPLFFYESEGRLFVVTSNGTAFEWIREGIGWSTVRTAPGVIKAIEVIPRVGLVAIVGSKVYLRAESGGDWVETTVTGTLPTTIKGQLKSQGRSFLWDGRKVYEWSTALTPLSCRTQPSPTR